MQHAPVRFEITFADLVDCVRCSYNKTIANQVLNENGTTTGLIATSSSSNTYLVDPITNDLQTNFICNCISTYQYLNTEDRKKITLSPHKINITSYQETVETFPTSQVEDIGDNTDFSLGSENSGISIDLDSMKGNMSSLLFQIIWNLPDSLNASTVDCTSQTLQGSTYITQQSVGLPLQGGFLNNFKLTLDGKERFPRTSGQVLSAIGAASINLPFNEYNDSIYGIKLGSPGYNMSKSQNATLQLTTYPTVVKKDNPNCNILTTYVYIPYTYNVVIQNGVAGILNYAHA